MPFDTNEFPTVSKPGALSARNDARLVAGWLFVVAGMIFVMISLGGATRLTGSGLSIMEWAPFRGALPPLDHAEWERLFGLYQQTPQYKVVNAGFGLQGFQQIFWLEWVHRLWGRLIGVAVIVPLAWFWAAGRLERRLRPRLVGLFLLGGLQGAAGWFMVASGFLPDTTSVSPYRLVVHLVLALILYAAILWTGLTTLRPDPMAMPGAKSTRRLCVACCASVGLTILAGGFVAGTHAGLDYNTFPLMGGALVPQGYAALYPFPRNLTENLAAVQFDHRMLATLTALITAATLTSALRSPLPRSVRRWFVALACAVAMQYSLGVLTLLTVVPTGLAVAHQAVAVLVLTAALISLHALRGGQPAAPARASAA